MVVNNRKVYIVYNPNFIWLKMEIYDPYELFEVDWKSIRLKENNYWHLINLCDIIEKEKKSVNIFGLENNDLKMDITITQELLSPHRYKIKSGQEGMIERVFSRFSEKTKIEGGYLYYTAPLYSITEDCISKNKIKNVDGVITPTINLSKFLEELGVDNKLKIITGSKKIRYLTVKDIKQLNPLTYCGEKYTTSIGADEIIYIFPQSEIIFETKLKEKKMRLEQLLSGNEKATLSGSLDILKKLGIPQNNKYLLGIVDNYPNLEEFKVKENGANPIIHLDNLFTFLSPKLCDSKFGFKYTTNQYYTISDDTDTLLYKFKELANITTIFFGFIGGNKLKPVELMPKNYDASCEVLQSLHYFSILAGNIEEKKSFN